MGQLSLEGVTPMGTDTTLVERVADAFGKLIAEQINQGILGPGDTIPAEQEIADVYGVSRPVVSKAMDRLKFQGLIVKHVGALSTIARPPK